MIQVSDKTLAVLTGSSRKFQARFLFGGSEVSGEIRELRIYKGSCGETQFIPGAVYSSYLETTLDGCNESLSGKELQCQIGIEVDDALEWYDIGYFTAYKPSTNIRMTSFTGIGRLSAKMGGIYVSSLTYPAKIQSVLDEISENTGVPIDAAGFDTMQEIASRPSGYLFREVIGMIAGLFLGYATEDAAGTIVFRSFKDENVITTDGERTTQLPEFEDEDVEITGVKVVVSSGSTDENEEADEEIANEVAFSDGIVNVAISDPYMTQEIFEQNKSNLIGYKYRPGIVTISLGDFRIEPFDTLQVTDDMDVVRNVPCMSVVHTFDGGLTTTVTAPGLENEEGDETAYRGQLSQTIERIQKELVSAQQVIADKVSTGEIEAVKGSIKKLETEKLSAEDAALQYATIKFLESGYAKIDLANVSNAWIEKGVLKDGSIGEAAIHEGAITNAKIADATIEAAKIKSINADTITAGTIKTDRLIITDDEGNESIVKAINRANGVSEAEVNGQKIQAASIEVADLSAFQARIAQFYLSQDAIYSGKESIEDGKSGIYISTAGIGMGDGTLTGKYESPLQAYADGSFKLLGRNSSFDFNTVTGELNIEASSLKISSKSVATRDDLDEVRDEITTLLRIESSRGSVFKNDQVATVLSVVLYHGKTRITDSETMHSIFGSGAYIQWKWQRLDDDSFGIISSSDARIGNDGFTFILSPEDVDTKVTFLCELIV